MEPYIVSKQKTEKTASKQFLITANVAGDASFNHMCNTLKMEYEKNGYVVLGCLETNLEHAEPYPNIVLNRLGVLPFPPNIVDKNMKLVHKWTADPDKLVTYYLDDLLIHMNNNLPLEYMRRCEKVVTSNYILKDYFENKCYIPEVEIVKTHSNWEFVDSLPKMDPSPRKEGKFLILWASLGRLGWGFMDKLCKKLNKCSFVDEIHIITLSMQAIFVRQELLKYRNIDFRFLEALPIDQFYMLAKESDMIINPVSMEVLQTFYKEPEMQELWLASKCENKFAVACACKTPLLSGPMRAYKEAIRDGEDGFLSSDVDEWIDIIKEIKDNEDLRKHISENARHRAETDYDHRTRALEYIAAFTKRPQDDEINEFEEYLRNKKEAAKDDSKKN